MRNYAKHIGDFNASIGKERIYESIYWNELFQETEQNRRVD